MATLTLTKLVKLEWDVDRSEQMLYAGEEIAATFVAQGKTDGTWTKNESVDFGGTRAFIDQAAAEEFISAMSAAGAANGRILLSSSITDI